MQGEKEQPVRFVNLNVYPETRARVNLLRARIEAQRLEKVTTDDIVSFMLSEVGVPEFFQENAEKANA
jgi:hypothetical protein